MYHYHITDPLNIDMLVVFWDHVMDRKNNRPTYCMELMLATPATRAQVYHIHSWEAIFINCPT